MEVNRDGGGAVSATLQFRLRTTARSLALTTLASADLATGRMAAGLSVSRVQFLLFHDVLPHQEQPFRELLKDLTEYHEFISYSEAVDRVVQGNIDRPYIAISFDDGRESCYRAARIMNEFSIGGCFFICPSIVGEPDPVKVREFAQKRVCESVPGFLSWRQVEEMKRDGHEFGGHSMTHADLGAASRQELDYEIGACHETIARALGEVHHFAWPFGRRKNLSVLAAQVVFQTGFRSCASAIRGCHQRIEIANALSTLAPVESAFQRPGVMLRRENLEANWPRPHVQYLLARGARNTEPGNDIWPNALSTLAPRELEAGSEPE